MPQAEIISEAKPVDCVEYSLACDVHGRGSGFAFKSDERGCVDFEGKSQTWLDNYRKVITDFITGAKRFPIYVQKYEWSYVEPAIARCVVCRAEVTLDDFTSCCDNCGQLYDKSGWPLQPRHLWEEQEEPEPSVPIFTGRGFETVPTF